MDKRAYFDDLAPRWDSLPPAPGAADATRRFVERLGLGEARNVVDLGSGTGVLVPHLSRAYPDSLVVELDFAPAMLRESLRQHPGCRLAAVCGDARSLPLATRSCDALLCFGVLPHLGNPAHFVAELLRPLRPGGIFAVGHVMNSHELNAFHGGLEGPVAADHLLPATELARLLAGAGAGSIVAEEEPGWYFLRAAAAE